MDDREQALLDQFSNVPPMAHDALMPDWIQREATQEDSWEVVEKKRLEVNAFARDFRRVFPDEAFSNLDSKGKPKAAGQDTQSVIAKAVTWLDKKFKGDTKLIKQVLLKSGLIDEHATQILSAFNETLREDDEKFREDAVKQHDKEDQVAQPSVALHDFDMNDQITVEDVTDDANSERLFKKAGMERRATIPPYGVIVTEDNTQIYCRGKLVTEFDTEVFGGFAMIADEVESLRTPTDVEALFGIESDPDTRVASITIGQSVTWKSAGMTTTGNVTALTGTLATVAIMHEGTRITVQVPIARLTNIAKGVEGSVYDDAPAQRADQNIGESGDFDDTHPIDMKKKIVDKSLDPASTVPGSATECAPNVYPD